MTIPKDAQTVIDLLGLQPHPEEGGWFMETWRAGEMIPSDSLDGRYGGTARNHGTAIYYLVTPHTFSALHKLESDEVFHFYMGDPVEQLQLFPDGTGRLVTLGPDLEAGQRPQVIVPRGAWQGAKLAEGGSWALMGCTVAPGFDFADYQHGQRAALTKGWPDQAKAIAALTTA
ncbi:MAG: cupin domain-containing protein [Rhodospirillum sp.]|nr:cupin domain-containing protein [Rhodospirillum sp.]MCF8491850.1 cupin domain-containing protein [Rhodospirillum sp.]MCF8501149.1 cupin domain-containing protein [Rhodospirillum sp.]